MIFEQNEITNPVKITSGTPDNAISYITLQAPQARGATATHSTIPNRYDSTDTTIIRPWNWNEADGTDSADAMPPMDGVSIKNNILKRTLPTAAAFSDYGFGSRLWQGVAYDPAITDAHLRPDYGVWLGNAASFIDIDIEENKIRHAIYGIYFNVAASNHLDYYGVGIRRNKFFDLSDYGFAAVSAAKWLGVIIEDNDFDLDYYRVNANSNLNGSFDADGTPTAIELGDYEGVIIRRNNFKNCCRTINSNVPTLLLIEENTVFCSTPAATGFNTGNKGVGKIPVGYTQYNYVIGDFDPTSATYGDITFIPVKSKASVPASGWYPAAWIVWNSAFALGGPIGWIKIASGTTHTDWVEINSKTIQAITGAGAISLNTEISTISNSTGGTIALTQAAPTAAQLGKMKALCMIAGDGTNTATVALTNFIGGSAATTATFDAAGEILLALPEFP